MKWGLIALGGKIQSAEALMVQLKRYVKEGDLSYVIGVDGGCALLAQLSIVPDAILGDFDSIGNLQQYRDMWPDAQIKTFPAEKDYTDAELAFEVMAEKDMDRIMVIGGFGGRADHMISILHLILKASNHVMIDEQNYLEKIEAPYKKVLHNKELNRTYISLIPTGDKLTGITLKGFKYPLTSAVIEFSQTLGISNELIDETGIIEVESGEGYLILSTD